MNAVGRLGSYISRGVYTVSGPFHPFGGCVDIIVVEQQDGTFKSSPWYVRFGKFQGVLKTREKVVNICVNGSEADFHMYLDHKGEAYFLKEVVNDEDDGVEAELLGVEAVLNNSSSGDEEVEGPLGSQSCGFGGVDCAEKAGRVAGGNGKAVARTNSRRAQILGLVFGRNSMRQSDRGREDDEMRRADSLERAEFAANLLEVKWSTNLATNKPMKDNASRICDSGVLEGRGGDRDARIDGSTSHSGSLSAGERSDETSTVVDGVTASECNAASDVAKCADECIVLASEREESVDGVLSGTACADSQVPADLEVCGGKQVDDGEKEVANRIGSGEVSECSISHEGGMDTVQSFIYCESSESSIVRQDASSEQTHETLYIGTGGSGELRVHSEVLRARTEPLSEDTVVEHILEDYGLEAPPVLGLDDFSEKTDPSCSGTDNYNVVLDRPLVELESCIQTNHTDPVLGSADEVVSQDVCTVSSFGNSFKHCEDEENMKVEDSTSELQTSSDSIVDCVTTEATHIQPSVSLEEEQLLFGDIDEFEIGEVRRTESNFPEEEGIDNFSKGVEINGLIDKNDQSQSSSELSPDCESSIGNVRVSSNPIAITGAHKVVGGEVCRLAESLPNMWSSTDSFGADDVNCLCHSLDSNSKPLNWVLQNKDNSSSAKLNRDEECQLVPEPSDMNDALETGEVKDSPSTPAVEMSLCKHLFYQGMGSDAASQAFDAEKLDLEKFSSLGPEVVKDDRLVVRINGHYFPWDVAAPMVLGKVSFGSEHIFEPKGMIAVDHAEKPVTGDPSNPNMSPGGNWRLWPFSFRRSRSRKAVQPSLSDVRNSDAENASEVKLSVAEDKSTTEPKVVKKVVRLLTPTSEQLASLNLNEGRNTVTFTFLTPMLGKQQVDCRIYLWKWNTRIVISDVDGTITRSDVLGQFMPLVGVDWSHLGVAHLFSAIKENGYQLLFLSARAISQAYITRQFLFNLKQDGKALPDGPVVISPDGLFPSLYREVIRRAPHEFKISCLEEIRSLFPSDCNPFYAGFGNRDTDEISYLKVGIPKGKIFIINPKGEVAVNRRVDTKSYKSIHALVNGMFPSTASSEQEDFNSWNFWKLPPPTVDV